MTITPEELDELKKLCVNALAGPWEYEPDEEKPHWFDLSCPTFNIGWACHKDSAEFICAARTALPRLIEEIERLTADRKSKNHYNKKKYLDIKNKRYDAVLCMRDNMGMKFAAIGVEIGRTEARAAAIYKEAKKRGTK